MPTAKTAKKAKRKSSGRNRIPALSYPDMVADTRFPIGFDAVPAMSDKLVQLWADESEWKKACRQAYTDGKSEKDLPTLASSKIPSVNAGRLSRTAFEKSVDVHNEALDEGKNPPASPPRYCPVEMELIQAIGCTVIRKGQGKKPPKNWDERKHGSWFHLDEDGNRTIPSGWILDSKRQRGCHKSVDKMVESPSDNVVTLGGSRYVIGAGAKPSEAALYQVDCSDRGSYGAIWDVRRRLCMAKAKGITNLVLRIEDRPNAGSAVKIDMGGGSFNFFMPGQSATPGYLTNGGGKELTAAQIRKAIEDETKGLKFKPLKDPILGEWVSMDMAYPEIKKAWKASKRPNTELNANVQCRVSHDEGYPFGFRGASVAIVPCFRWAYDGNKYSLEMNLVVGSRMNAEYNVSKQEAKAAYNEANPEAEVVEEKPAKTKKTKASKKTKTAKPKPASKPAKPVDEPAPIVADTADDADAEEDEVTALDEQQRELANADAEAAESE